MSSADVTRRELTLGSRDDVLGHCGKVFAESTIKAVIVHNGISPVNLPIGMYARFEHTAFIPDVIHLGDEIIDAQGKYYLVKGVQEMWWLNQFDGYICNLNLIDEHFDRPATSGTWHVDSDSLKTDNRYRHKLLLDTYITTGHLKMDNGTSNADFVVMFSGADYPLKYELGAAYNDIDLIFAIDKGSSTPILNAYKYPYKTGETVTIQTFAINKTGLTAINLLDQAYEEIKEVFTDHPLGSKRRFTRTQLDPKDMGGLTIYSEIITIEYVRINDDYTPTYPTITWGTSDDPDGTFTFPNVTYISPPSKVNNVRLMPNGRMGNILQKLGMPDFQITIHCDLDMEPSTLTWMRPQTTTPKTDVVPWQIFWDIQFNGQIDEYYQTLDLGWGGTIQVTLEEVTPIQQSSGWTLELVFYAYNVASGSSYTTWFGLS